jgi:transcriptional regulator with PAS, ATPase and Fis domain
MRGHRKGAFTGAIKEEKGWFEKSHDGVLFLDEFQNASLFSQTQLLDLLDPLSNDILINRMGESNRSRFNVKVILATNEPVDKLLSEKKLRADLFYRIRDVIKLPSLNDALESYEAPAEKMAEIRRLFYIYRWKSSPYGGEGLAYDADFAPLFPVVEESVAEPIQNFRWEGNYRQFERVVSDIYWQNDTECIDVINGNLVHEQLEKERVRLGSDSPPVCAVPHLRVVQDRLLEHGFNIGKTVEALSLLKINLGSRHSLRSFLREHHDSLNDEIRKDSKVVRFLWGNSNKAPSTGLVGYATAISRTDLIGNARPSPHPRLADSRA